MAHSLRLGGFDASNNYRPVNTGYGVVNSIGMPCLLGVQIAKQCGVSDPVVDQMIDRAKMFYASYAKRGSIPYGEHDPFDSRHENNGKNGLAAILLDNLPAYDPADGYEIAGFGWHQGWNDRVTPAFAAEYEANMEQFITDVRTSLGVPDLPFVIATTGMDGNPDYSQVELAQLQMENFAAYPQFDGNVAVTDTQGFWFAPASSPANQGYHWNRNAKTYYLIGDSMAAEMQALLANTGPSATPYADWATANGVTGAFGDDDDANGIVNGHEWYFDQATPQFAGLATTGPGTFGFSHLRPTNRADVTETYQWSRNLLTWHAADGSASDGTNTVSITEAASTAGPGPDHETVTLEAVAGGPAMTTLFLRLELSHP